MPLPEVEGAIVDYPITGASWHQHSLMLSLSVRGHEYHSFVEIFRACSKASSSLRWLILGKFMPALLLSLAGATLLTASIRFDPSAHFRFIVMLTSTKLKGIETRVMDGILRNERFVWAKVLDLILLFGPVWVCR